MSTVDGEYTPSPTPKPHPRIKPEASDYAERNRGTMERWFDYSGGDGYESPRPINRSVTDEGRKNAEMNKGSMGGIMGGYADPPMQRTVHPRGVKLEGEENANQNKGGAMRELIDNYGNLGVSEQPAHKVHGADAESYAERNHGTVDNLMNNYGQLSPDQQPPQKLGNGGEEVAAKHTGAGMGPLLHMEGGNGGRTEQEPRAAGKLHQTSQGAGRVQTEPLRTRPEARSNLHKNQSSEMSAIMHGESSPSHQAKKSNRMMQRSEDW